MNNQIQSEFREFCDNTDSLQTNDLFILIKKKLFPSPKLVFIKLLSIHFVVGYLSLAICSQFGLNPFHSSVTLMDYFMKIGGHSFCMFACGLFFMSTTYLSSNAILSLEEIEVFNKFKHIKNSILIFTSLVVFYFMGAHLSIAIAALWLTGALIGSYSITYLNLKFRKDILQY